MLACTPWTRKTLTLWQWCVSVFWKRRKGYACSKSVCTCACLCVCFCECKQQVVCFPLWIVISFWCSRKKNLWCHYGLRWVISFDAKWCNRCHYALPCPCARCRVLQMLLRHYTYSYDINHILLRHQSHACHNHVTHTLTTLITCMLQSWYTYSYDINHMHVTIMLHILLRH
jgi:hypothetical protein